LAVAAALRLLFFGEVTRVVVVHVLRARRITSDTIAAASCAYMLLGMVWANLYLLLDYMRPGAIDIPSSFTAGFGGDPGPALTYFSFVTLATVGYGGMKPLDPGTGGLCVAEALVGQLYLAIMISRMVGLHIAQRPN